MHTFLLVTLEIVGGLACAIIGAFVLLWLIARATERAVGKGLNL